MLLLAGGVSSKPNEVPPEIVKSTKSRRLIPTLTDITAYFKEYCFYSGLHGMHYLAEDRRSCIERIFWVAALTMSALGCSLMILQIKAKVDKAPVIVTISESPTNIWHVPFPAVTVCPVTKSRNSVFNFTKFVKIGRKKYAFVEGFLKWVRERGLKLTEIYQAESALNHTESNDTDDAYRLFENVAFQKSIYQKLWALHTVCDGFSSEWDRDSNGSSTIDQNAIEFLLEVAPEMNTGQLFPNNVVTWNSNNTPLDVHFKHSWTQHGLCFTFNMMDNIYVYNDQVVNNDIFKEKGLDKNFPKLSNDWDPDTGFSKIFKYSTYPYRAPYEIEHDILRIKLMENHEDTDECWGRGARGYTVILHQPQDHPHPSQNGVINLPFFKFITVSVKLEVMTTSPELEKYDAHKRQCYYSYEKRLEYFKFYSQNNCELECLTNATLKMCGCVAYYMPRYSTTRICGRDSYKCMADAALKSKKEDIEAALKDLADSGVSPFTAAITKTECDCLPSCLSITYETEVSSRDLEHDVLSYEFQLPPNYTTQMVTFSALNVGFRKEFYFATQRKELSGEIEFLASCGGLAGLFSGFSIISLIEVIYFLTIRLWTNIYMRLTSKPQTTKKPSLSEETGWPRRRARAVSQQRHAHGSTIIAPLRNVRFSKNLFLEDQAFGRRQLIRQATNAVTRPKHTYDLTTIY